ncbi:MAG: zf-HC2 domain-containing protein [Planctomycetota bacterium]
MKNHEPFRELLALRLYGELDDAEARALAAHLAGCDACARFADELEHGLGAAPRGETGAAELPDGWRERLDDAIRPAAASRWRWAAPFAAGLAAGVLLMGLRPEPEREQRASGSSLVTNAGAGPELVLRPGPPPPASGRGTYARLGDLLGEL